MEQSILRFGGGTDTTINLLTLVVLFVSALIILRVSRRLAVFPLVIAGSIVSLSQVVNVVGLHFTALRILILFAWIRIALDYGHGRTNKLRSRLTQVDTALLAFAICQALCFNMLYHQEAALIKSLGVLYDTLGLYFLFRIFLTNDLDNDRCINILAILSVFFAAFMTIEQITGHNLLSVFGGAPLDSTLREGRLRSQGSFAHPILAGVFGATLLPIFWNEWRQRTAQRKSAAFGLIGCTVMTLTCASNGPPLAYLAGVVALGFWPLRSRMRSVRWILAGAIVSLQLVMKAPVWALIARVDFIGGSSGYHRYQLVDQFIRHISSWWLVGTTDTSSWGFFLFDTANEYIDVGVTGGIFTLVLFVWILVRAFGLLGTTRSVPTANITKQRRLWAFGAALFSHAVAFMGVSYFDQTRILWFLLLAMISAEAGTPHISASSRSATHASLDMPNFTRSFINS
ncbi:MAG: hypothetical protein LAP85_22205 [Acidobacteriia bacterium]|nr:hypothetical protein [Terriglobia bacterium]